MNKRSLLPLAMLLLVAAGALLPVGTAALDSSRLENRVDARPLPDIHLELRPERGVEDTLSIWTQDNMKIELSQGGECSEQESRKAAETVINLLAEHKLLPTFYSGAELDSIYPLAVISDSEPNMAVAGKGPNIAYSSAATPGSGSNHAAVIWCGNMAEPTPYLQIFIDDATGKLVAISYDIEEAVNPSLWTEFLEEYYDPSDLQTVSLSGSRASVWCVWELTWKRDGQDLTCPFIFTQKGNTVYINYINM